MAIERAGPAVNHDLGMACGPSGRSGQSPPALGVRRQTRWVHTVWVIALVLTATGCRITGVAERVPSDGPSSTSGRPTPVTASFPPGAVEIRVASTRLDASAGTFDVYSGAPLRRIESGAMHSVVSTAGANETLFECEVLGTFRLQIDGGLWRDQQRTVTWTWRSGTKYFSKLRTGNGDGTFYAPDWTTLGTVGRLTGVVDD